MFLNPCSPPDVYLTCVNMEVSAPSPGRRSTVTARGQDTPEPPVTTVSTVVSLSSCHGCLFLKTCSSTVHALLCLGTYKSVCVVEGSTGLPAELGNQAGLGRKY